MGKFNVRALLSARFELLQVDYIPVLSKSQYPKRIFLLSVGNLFLDTGN